MDETKPLIGTGEGESPLTGPIDNNQDSIRTMNSDIQSLQETGGQTVKPYTPNPSTPSPSSPPSSSQTLSSEKPAETVFQPPTVEVGPPPPSGPTPPTTEAKKPTLPNQSHKKGFLFGLITLLAVIGLGGIAYFYVYPNYILPRLGGTSEMAPPTTPPIESPTVPPVEVPAAEPPIPQQEESTSTPIVVHNSLFKIAADVTQEISLNTINLENLKSALNLSTTSASTIKELILKNAEGEFLKFGQVMNLVLPDIFNDELNNLFEENDFTVFVYGDSRDNWLGFIGKIKNAADLETAKQKVALLETSANLKNIFNQDPGTGQDWKSGQTNNGVANRYIVFTQKGAALNYGWLNNYLIISASYDGFKEALKRL